MNRAATLEQLAKLCRGDRDGAAPRAVHPTGCSTLDAVLPAGGWQAGTIVELMPTEVGIGELHLLTPALARMTQAERHIAFIAPPFIPFAPALSQRGIDLGRLLIIRAERREDVLWSMEQILRCQSVGAALAWPVHIKDREVRRLQLAAEAGGAIGFLYREPQAALEASPAAMRLRLQRSQDALQIEILKCRGARSGLSVSVASTPDQEASVHTLTANR